MKLKLSFLPALLLAALMVLPSAFSALQPDFSLELARLRAPAPVAGSADSVPAMPWARGAGAKSMGVCRDSVVNGSWDIKVFHVGDYGDTAVAAGDYPTWGGTIEDSLNSYTTSWVWIYPLGGRHHGNYLNGERAITNGDDCVSIVGWSNTTGGDGDGALLTWDTTNIDSASIRGVGNTLALGAGEHWTIVGTDMSSGMCSNDQDVIGFNAMSWTFVSNSHFFYNCDEIFSRVTNNATVNQNHGFAYSMLGPGSGNRGVGGIVGTSGSDDGVSQRFSDYMIYYAELKQRGLRYNGSDTTQAWSSISYNWSNKIGVLNFADTLGVKCCPWTMHIEYVNMRYRPGPWTGNEEVILEVGFNVDTITTQIYLENNFHDSVETGFTSHDGRGEGGSVQPGDSSMFIYQSFTDSSPSDSMFTTTRIKTWPDFPMIDVDTAAVRDTLITQKKVGRWSVQNCAGEWVDKRNDASFELKDTMISRFVNGTGTAGNSTHDEPTDYIPGGYPEYDPGTVCADSDMDGLTDSVELAITSGASSTSVNSATETTSGYLYIELISYVGAENDPWTYTLAEVIGNCSPGEACAALAAGHVATYNDTINLYTDTMVY
jgi:hypothetical protein